MLARIIDFLYPPACTVCSSAAVVAGTGGLFCAACEPERSGLAAGYGSVQVSVGCCSRCGEYVTAHGQASATCVACAVWPLPIARLRSQFSYEGRVEAAIKALKYGGERRLCSYFAEQLALALHQPAALYFTEDAAAQCCELWDVFVPVPSSSRSLRERGFGHTAFIARKAAALLHTRADVTALKSIKPRKRQTDCAPDERFTNVKDCFAASPRSISGKRVLLIDDVLTTGATVTSAACALLDAGARSVDAITIARSRKFRSLRLVRSAVCEPTAQAAVGYDE